MEQKSSRFMWIFSTVLTWWPIRIVNKIRFLSLMRGFFNNTPDPCSFVNTIYPQENQISTIYCVPPRLWVKEKSGAQNDINEKRLQGRGKKRRAITKKEGTLKKLSTLHYLLSRGAFFISHRTG